jgi:hypothetical protein
VIKTGPAHAPPLLSLRRRQRTSVCQSGLMVHVKACSQTFWLGRLRARVAGEGEKPKARSSAHPVGSTFATVRLRTKVAKGAAASAATSSNAPRAKRPERPRFIHRS